MGSNCPWNPPSTTSQPESWSRRADSGSRRRRPARGPTVGSSKGGCQPLGERRQSQEAGSSGRTMQRKPMWSVLGGGQIIAQGTPEQVAKSKASFTGRYLAPLLKREALEEAAKAEAEAEAGAEPAKPKKAVAAKATKAAKASKTERQNLTLETIETPPSWSASSRSAPRTAGSRRRSAGCRCRRPSRGPAPTASGHRRSADTASPWP